MLKARGLEKVERLLDHTMEMSAYLWHLIRTKLHFRAIIDQPFQYTNISFWFIPVNLRGLDETTEWWENLYKVAPIIKERMIKSGTLMVGYSPLPNKGKGNFFRMAVTCHPPATRGSIDFVLDEIERLGSDIVV